MGAATSIPEQITLAEAKALVPEDRWQPNFDQKFALAAEAKVPKRLALEAYAKAERRRERFEGSGCVAGNRWREYEDPDGNRYRVDRATGASAWADEARGDDVPRDFVRERDEESGCYFYANSTAATPRWETPRWDQGKENGTENEGDGGDDDVWHEEFDEYHQQAYYVNAKGESRWTCPTPRKETAS